MTDARKPKKILIIDDQESSRELLKIYLEQEQLFEVHSAEDGETGLSVCQREKPHLIILDVNLPGILGIEVAETIHASPSEYGSPKIIVLTGIAYSSENIRQRWIHEFKVSDFFTKPLDSQTILKRIKELLEV